MADDKTALTVSEPVPSYLEEYSNEGTQNIKANNMLQRLKVIQDLRRGDYKEFSPGSLVLSPDQICLCSGDNPQQLGFVPLYHFSLYALIEPLCANVSYPVVESTTDETSDIARRSQDSNLWWEYHPDHPAGSPDAEKWRRRYVHQLCFVVMIDGFPLPALLTFSKGDFKRGRKLCSTILMRKAPIWAQRYMMQAKVVDNASGDEWWALGVNPDLDQPFVSQELAASYREQYAKLDEMFQGGVLADEAKSAVETEDETAEVSDTL